MAGTDASEGLATGAGVEKENVGFGASSLFFSSPEETLKLKGFFSPLEGAGAGVANVKPRGLGGSFVSASLESVEDAAGAGAPNENAGALAGSSVGAVPELPKKLGAFADVDFCSFFLSETTGAGAGVVPKTKPLPLIPVDAAAGAAPKVKPVPLGAAVVEDEVVPPNWKPPPDGAGADDDVLPNVKPSKPLVAAPPEKENPPAPIEPFAVVEDDEPPLDAGLALSPCPGRGVSQEGHIFFDWSTRTLHD